MVSVEELEETINWLHKLQAADSVSGSINGYSDNAIRLAQQGDKHIKTIREGKGYIETIDSISHFPKMKYFEDYIEKLNIQLEHIKKDKEPTMHKEDKLDMNTVYRGLIRMLAGMANEIRMKEQN